MPRDHRVLPWELCDDDGDDDLATGFLTTDLAPTAPLDLDEVADLDEEEPRRGPFGPEVELDADHAYRCLLAEALGDGDVDSYEWMVLTRLGRELGLAEARRQELEDEARTLVDEHGVRGPREADLDPGRLVQQLFAEADRDGSVSPGELAVMERVARCLEVDPGLLRALRRAAARRQAAERAA